jgi:hypothetical protein
MTHPILLIAVGLIPMGSSGFCMLITRSFKTFSSCEGTSSHPKCSWKTLAYLLLKSHTNGDLKTTAGYSGFQSHGVRPLVPMPYAPRPDPTRMYSSQPGTAISLLTAIGITVGIPGIGRIGGRGRLPRADWCPSNTIANSIGNGD